MEMTYNFTPDTRDAKKKISLSDYGTRRGEENAYRQNFHLHASDYVYIKLKICSK